MDGHLLDILRRTECGMTTYIDALDLRRYIETLEARLAKFDGPGRVHRIVFVPDDSTLEGDHEAPHHP